MEQELLAYLKNERHLTDTTIIHFGLHLSSDNQWIVIPIRDENGKHLFNKYRRAPWVTDLSVPKYKYDKGAQAALFNREVLSCGSKVVFIVEGEFDCMLVHQNGAVAVSST